MIHWHKFYQPPDAQAWHVPTPRSEQFREQLQICDLTASPSLEKKTKAIVGFSCDAGVSRNHGRAGAKDGPKALRPALSKLISVSQKPVWDLGNLVCPDADLESAQQALGSMVEEFYQEKDRFLLVVGGGHETAFGHYLGLQKRTKRLAIINLDAHLDFRLNSGDPTNIHLGGNSGTSFRQIAELCKREARWFSYTCIGLQDQATDSMQRKAALSYNSQLISAADIHTKGWQIVNESLKKTLAECDGVYLSICLDVFSESIVCGVSAPQPFGLFPFQVLPIIDVIKKSGKLAACDVVELAPGLDASGASTKVAAGIAAMILD